MSDRSFVQSDGGSRDDPPMRTAGSPGTARKLAHPLGPLVEWGPFPAGLGARVLTLALAAGCLGVLGLGLWLEPDPRGFGTHRQLGFGPCGMQVLSGLPCPTCGMTTAFAHTVRGRLWAGLKAQPMGAVLCLLTGLTALVSLHALVRGRVPRINWYRISPSRTAIGFVGLLIAAWAYKLVATLLDAAS